jgi:hypothetical protein
MCGLDQKSQQTDIGNGAHVPRMGSDSLIDGGVVLQPLQESTLIVCCYFPCNQISSFSLDFLHYFPLGAITPNFDSKFFRGLF